MSDERRDRFTDDVAPYLLGALDDAEHQAFVAHLRECQACQELVATLQPVADALPAAAPQLQAPDALRGRLMATVRSEASLRAGTGRAPRATRREKRAWRLAAVIGAAALAATAVVLVVVLAGGGSSTRVIRARLSVASASASLRISSGHGTLRMTGMPRTPAGKVYEVWIERAGAPQPTGALFTVGRHGAATVAVPGSLAGAGAVMVTAEPAGGSRVPTSAPLLVARLS